MARRKLRPPKSPQPINLALQDTHVQRRFPNFSCRIKRGCATWRGSLQPRSVSPIYQVLDFIHLVDKKGRQDKLISPTKEKSYAYLAPRDYDSIDAIYASL